jgi:parallel beta-helix repeat protein
VIYEDSQFVGDVTCTMTGAPCIQFGASGIKLKLNGFTMTGLADPVRGCAGVAVALEDGINVPDVADVKIQGPGVVRQFRLNGIRVQRSTGVKIERVTASTNCTNGISLARSSDNDVRDNVSVRNGSTAFDSGGIAVTNDSNNNRIMRNEVSGNGYADPPGAPDFGIGILNGSSNNVVKENSAVGNANGILIGAASGGFGNPSGNIVRENIIVGNPPIQVSNSFPAFTGVDIRDLSPSGANTFENNLCLTYSGAGPAPCPNTP